MNDPETTTDLHEGRVRPGPEAARDLTGRLLGGEFLVERLLGRGGMGEVYLARQRGLNRPVALKVLRPELAADPTYLGRFEVEAAAVARLNHPNIVQVYTLGRDHDLRFIAMEYVEGNTLGEELRRHGALDPARAVAIMRQTCRAMSAAGELGLIHRDLKPDNLLLTRDGRVKVADFGLCREQGADSRSLTREGITLGTPLYMSPEQVRGLPLDPRSDLYAMGVTFYHLLAGTPPFRAESAIAVALKHLQEEPPDLAVVRPDLPPGLVAIVMRLLAKRPEDRYATAREVEDDLARLPGLATAEPVPPTIPAEAGATIPLAPSGRRDTGPSRAPRIGRARSPSPASLATLGALGLVLGAVLGWAARPADLLAGGVPSGPPALWIDPGWRAIPRQPSPRDQLRYAQLRARPSERPAALLAVAGHFPGSEPWATAAYTHLARLLLDRLDRDRLGALAESLEADAEADSRRRRLADICRAAAAALDDRPDAALEHLTARAPAPSYLDPPLAELALEVAEWARGNPAASQQAAQWANVREDLLQALRVVTVDPAERFEPGRRRPAGRP